MLAAPRHALCRFDGLTQLHAFQLGGGQVSVRSRHLYPEIEAHIARHGVYSGFAGPQPARGVLGMLARRTLQVCHR